MPQPTPGNALVRPKASRAFAHGDVVVDKQRVRHVVEAVHVDERETTLLTVRLDTGESAVVLGSQVAYRVRKP